MKSLQLAIILTISIPILLGSSNQAFATHTTFSPGDVFASVNNGLVNWYHPDGTFNQAINCGSGFTTGSATDSTGNLYVTMFSSNAVCVVDTSGTPTGTIGSGYSTPESIVFDSAGNFYVGNLGNGIRKYDSTGTLLQAMPGPGRVDWMDLASDQCTMIYGQEGSDIKRWDVCNDVALSNFCSSCTQQAFAMRILPNGDVLVADQSDIKRFNSAGALQQNYQPNGISSGWFALNLDPDGTSFWTGTFSNDDFYKVDISTEGILVGPISTTAGSNNLFGLSVFGEITAATCPPGTTGTPPNCIAQDIIGGEILPVNTSALLLAGTFTNAIWMGPLLVAGAAGAAAFFIKTRKN